MVCALITGAPYAVDPEHLSEKLVSAESVLEHWPLRANCLALPNLHGNSTDSERNFLSAD